MHAKSSSIEATVHALSQSVAGRTACGKPICGLAQGESALQAEQGSAGWVTCPACRESLTTTDFEPRSTLVVPEHHLTHARYPFVDIHNHQHASLSTEELDALVRDMDGLRLQVMVNLSGSYGATLTQRVANLCARYPNRFIVFANIDFNDLDAPDYPERVVAQYHEDIGHGARGLKLFKNFGMDLYDKEGRRIPVDDARFDELFAACGYSGTPVLIHTAEPAPFFLPVDKFNERVLELTMFPARVRDPRHYPPWQTLMNEQYRLLARHPKTNFISAHLGWLGGNLDELGRLMDRLPNMYTDIAAVLQEVARQPRHARAWFIRYQDRVLFGKDSWNVIEYHTYFRVLETADEYFDHFRRYQCSWKLYGLDLPDTVLRKIYYENALKLLPGVEDKAFR